MKTEPDVFSIDDLFKAPRKISAWEGVRNYQARNFMRDLFKLGDEVFIYHSSCAEPGIAGIAVVTKEAYLDPSALNVESPYFDQASKKLGTSRWCMVDVRGEKKFSRIFSLKQIKEDPKLKSMSVCQKGSRLSIQPVAEQHFRYLTKLCASML